MIEPVIFSLSSDSSRWLSKTACKVNEIVDYLNEKEKTDMIDKIIHEELQKFYGTRLEAYAPKGITIKEYNDIVTVIKKVIERVNECKML